MTAGNGINITNNDEISVEISGKGDSYIDVSVTDEDNTKQVKVGISSDFAELINNLEKKIEELENKFVTVTFSMSSALWATLILPFDHDLPEGLTAYIVTGLSSNNGVVLEEETTSLKANTPYQIKGTEDSIGTYTFTGIPTNIKDKYSKGIMVGTYKYLSVANGDFRCDGTESLLQNHDGEVTWYSITSESSDADLDAYHCYLDITLS